MKKKQRQQSQKLVLWVKKKINKIDKPLTNEKREKTQTIGQKQMWRHYD